MDGKHQFPPANQQIEKNQGHGENIGQQSLGVYASHLNISLIAHERNSLKPHSKVSHGVHYPKNL
jgi:hypothetical protein